MKGSSMVVVCLVLTAGLVLGASSGAIGTGNEASTSSFSMKGVVLAPNEVVLEPCPTELEWAYNPDETLHYDIGDPANSIGLSSGGRFRTGVRFTPTFTCSLKAIIFFQNDGSSNDYAFVFGENVDTFPGAILDSMPYSGGAQQTWKRVDLTSPLVFKAGTDFWTCVRFTHISGTYPAGADAGPIVRNRGGFLSTGLGWQQLSEQGLDANWSMRAIVSRGTQLTHNVGVTRIFVPGTAIGSGAYQPRFKIANFGSSAESNIPVTCKIDSSGTEVYKKDTTYAGPLQPGATAVITIPTVWNTGPSGSSYDVAMYTSLATDMDLTDDTLSQTTAVLTGQVLMTHDTGYCALSVTSFGAIGFDMAADAGVGFKYPKTAASGLYYGAFAAGNGPDYVADRHFGNPPGIQNADLVTLDSLNEIFPPKGDEQFAGAYTDAGHASPKGLQITQNSYQCAGTGYDDFVVMEFAMLNTGSSDINGLYAGVFADFDIGSASTDNVAASDTVRRLAYMKPGTSNENPSMGLKILAPASFANLSAVDHAVWVYPESAMTDGMKWRFLNGTVVQRTSNRPYDWSVMASAGPFDLPVGAKTHFALAFVGGTSVAALLANADSAQSWFDANPGVEQGPVNSGAAHRFDLAPNPFRNRTLVNYYSPRDGMFELSVYDAGGRLVDKRMADVKAGTGSYLWEPRNLARGVYFLDVKTPENQSRLKTLLLE